MSVRAGALGLLALTAGLALWLAAEAGVAGPAAVPELTGTGVVAVLFFALCGYGPARLLLPERMLPRLWLYIAPVGVACGTLALTLLGLLHVPFDVNLAVVLVAAVVAAVVALRRGPPVRAGSRVVDLIVPVALCGLIAGVACLPSVRSGFPAVQGQNGDAVLSVGTAVLLQLKAPGTIEPALGLDRVHPFWRSKLPIYYGLAAVARLSGQDPLEAFTATAAVMLALALLGFMLFVRDGLRGPPLVALAVLAVVGFDRMVLNTVYGPYFNQLWALFALPFALLFAWDFLQAPARRSAALAALFVALALFAYPLLVPFPVVFGVAVAWHRRHQRGWLRALRLPAPQRAGVRYALIALVSIPVAAVLVRGVVEKAVPGLIALAPGGDLGPWSGSKAYLPFYPFGWFFGVSMPPVVTGIVLAIVFITAAYGVYRLRGEGALALGVLVIGGLLGAVWLLIRGAGELFYFKDLSFTGALVAMLAVIGAASLRQRGAAVLAVAALALVMADSARDAVVRTYEQTPRAVLELREWDREIPTDQSIRLDVPPSGWQLWAWYLLERHRLSVTEPLGGFFPHPPVSPKADLVLVLRPGTRPADAIGPPLRSNDTYTLYRLDPDLPGIDYSTQRLIFDL